MKVRQAIVSAVASTLAASAAFAGPELRWEQLAPLPDAHGFAGAFAGVSGGALLVAGGANFPDHKPWEGGAKVWHDRVFALERPDGAWREVGKLPSPLGYGASVSHERGLVCIGGSNARGHSESVRILRYAKSRLEMEPLPDLPQPCANMSGALVGQTIYVAGGIGTPTATQAMDSLFSLDLSSTKPAWRRLEPLPAPGRMFAVAGAHGDSFYVFGGAALKAGPDGSPLREWLRDAYRYTPGKGWKRLADLPRPAVAAPSPAPVLNGRLLVLGGDDGTQVNSLPTAHKGFPREMLAYDPKADRWTSIGEGPFSLVTTPAVEWSGRLVVPGGEVRPGIRSTEVWSTSAR